MSPIFQKRVMAGILICLIIIALKPVSMYDTTPPQTFHVDQNNGEQVIQLAENRIAIIDTNWNSGMHGEMYVFEFNEETNQFEFISRDNYAQLTESNYNR